ncbi:MAG: hypothetical protein WC895_05245 [Candidatus Shapirobacteria bacterium]|jgi:hypothetical protein
MTKISEVFVMKEMARSLSLTDDEVTVIQTAIKSMVDDDIMGAASGRIGNVNLHALNLKLKPRTKTSMFGGATESVDESPMGGGGAEDGSTGEPEETEVEEEY